MLTERMKGYLSAKKREKYNKSMYNRRLATYSKQALKDLALVAEKASDEDLRDTVIKIFRAENLTPLIHAILKHPSREEKFEISRLLIESGHGGIVTIGKQVLPESLLNLYVNEFWRSHLWIDAVGYYVKKASEEKPEVKKPSGKVHGGARA